MNKLLLCFFLVCGTASAETNVVGHMKLNLTVGLEVSEICSMNWGKLVSTGEGLCTVNELGRTASGKVTISESDYSTNQFNIRGGQSATCGLSLPTSATVSNGVTTLQIINLTSNAVNGVITLNASGEGLLKVGGTVVVPSTFVGGNFNGVYNFILNYN